MYVGVDLHRKRSHVVALDPAGEVLLSRRIGNAPAEFLRIFGELEPQPIQVAFEATYGRSWFADLLADAGIAAHMAPPAGHQGHLSRPGQERRRGCQDPGPSVADLLGLVAVGGGPGDFPAAVGGGVVELATEPVPLGPQLRRGRSGVLAILQRLVATLEPPRGEDPIVSQRLQVIRARDRALLLFGFTGGFRRSELVALDVEDISEDEHGLVALVRRSKTDPEGEGLEKVIPYGSSLATCPVRAWRAWLAVWGISSGPAFRGVDRHGRVGTARTGRPGPPDGRLTSDAVSRIIKRCARQAGYDPERFSGHSLRAGFVTTAAERGATEAEIMEQTGHKTERMVRRYIRRGTRWSNPAAAKLGL